MNQQSSDGPLMSRGRGRRHNQLPGDDLVPIAVVGQRADHGGSPAFSGVWHSHIVLGSAHGGQVDGGGARSAPRTQKTPQTQQKQPLAVVAAQNTATGE